MVSLEDNFSGISNTIYSFSCFFPILSRLYTSHSHSTFPSRQIAAVNCSAVILILTKVQKDSESLISISAQSFETRIVIFGSISFIKGN